MGWKDFIPEKTSSKWLTLKVEEDVQVWLKQVATKHKSSVTRVLYAIIKAAYEEDTKKDGGKRDGSHLRRA